MAWADLLPHFPHRRDPFNCLPPQKYLYNGALDDTVVGITR